MPVILKEGLNLSTADIKCLENDLNDIDAWIVEAVKGKVANCRARLEKEWLPRLFKDDQIRQIPANTDALIAMIVQRRDYKNRVQRDASEA